MDASPLAKIPGELRNQIYLAYFEQTDVICVDIDGERPFVQPHILALMGTCRQIYHESLEVFSKATPTARFRIRTNALTEAADWTKDEILAKVALVLFGGQSQVCAYGIREVEIHLGELDLKNEAVKARIQAKPREPNTLLQDGWDREVVTKMTTLAAAVNVVPCRLVCTLALHTTPQVPIQVTLSETSCNMYQVFCSQYTSGRIQQEWQEMLAIGSTSVAQYEQRQTALPLLSNAYALLVNQLYPPVPINARLLPEDVRCYREAVRQRGSYTAADISKRRLEIAKRIQRDRDLHCFSMV